MLKSLRLIQSLLILTWLMIPVGAYYIHYQSKSSRNELNHTSLSIIATLTKEAQRKYSVEVFNKFKKVYPIESGRDHLNHPTMVPIPATFAIELSKSVSNSDLTIRMFSQHPFKGRENSAVPKDSYEKNALDEIIKNNLSEYTYYDNQRYIYAIPIKMTNESCIDCHNNHPDSQYKQWKLGDTRAILASQIYYQSNNLFYFYPLFFLLITIAIITPIILLQKLSYLDYFAKKSVTDNLTGIYNREYIDTTLREQFLETFATNRDNTSAALLMIDIDHFKIINDTYGHKVGDHCLIEISQQIVRTLKREKDTIARYGGEEFLVYLCNTNYDNALTISNLIRSNIASAPITDKRLNKTASIGVCYVSHQTNSPAFNKAIEIADNALYEAKKTGRNKVVIHRYS